MNSIIPLIFFYMIIISLPYIALCDCVRRTANRFNRNGIGWFFMSLLISPFLGAIMVHCLGKIEDSMEHKVNDFKLTDAEKAHILNRRENKE